MGKKIELFSYRFACEYCGHITPWQSKIGSSDLLKDYSPSQASQKHDLDEMFSSKPSRVPLVGYQQAFSEGKYHLLDANVRCPSCKKVQYWSWKPNQSPKTIFDGLWLWGVLSIILLLCLAVPITIVVLLLSITEISTLMLLYGLLPVGLGFALSVAVTIEANNIYHKNLHDFETVKAKNVPEIKWNEKTMGHTPFTSQDAINGSYSSKEPPPLWESLSVNQNTLDGNTSERNDPSRTSAPLRPSMPPLSSEPINHNAFHRQEQKRKVGREPDRGVVKENTSQRIPGNPATRDTSIRENTQEASSRHLSARDLAARENTQEATKKREITVRGASARETALRGVANEKAIKTEGSQGMTTREATRKAAKTSEKHFHKHLGPEDPSKVASLWEASEHKELTSFTETTTKRRKKIGSPQGFQNQSPSRSRETLSDKYQPSPWSSPQQNEISAKKSSRMMSAPDLPRGNAVSPSINSSFPGRSMPDKPMSGRPLTNRPLTDRPILRTPPVSDKGVTGDNREAPIGKRREREQNSEKLRERSIKDVPRDASRTSPKTSYDIELIEVGGDSFQVMKVVREITGLPFRETQSFVESVPKILVSGVSQATADSIRAKFNRLDAVIRIRPRH